MTRGRSTIVGVVSCFLSLLFAQPFGGDLLASPAKEQVQPSLIDVMHWVGYWFLPYYDDTLYGTPEMLQDAGFNKAMFRLDMKDTTKGYLDTCNITAVRQIWGTYDAGSSKRCQTHIIADSLNGAFIDSFGAICDSILERDGFEGITGAFWDVEFPPFPYIEFKGGSLAVQRGLCCDTLCIAEYETQYGHDIDDSLNPGLAIDYIQFDRPVLDQSQTVESDSIIFGRDSTSLVVAQTFKPDSCFISKIEVKVRRTTPNGSYAPMPPIRAELKTTDDGEPDTLMHFLDGREAYWLIRSHCTTPDSFVTLKFYFDCELDTSQTYAVVFMYEVGSPLDTTKGYWLRSDTASSYGDGQALSWNAVQNAWQPVGDLCFKTYYPSQRSDSLREDWVDFKSHQIATIAGLYRQKMRDVIGKRKLLDTWVPTDTTAAETLGYSVQYDRLAQSFRPRFDELCTLVVEGRKVGAPDSGFYVSIHEMVYDPDSIAGSFYHPSNAPLMSPYYIDTASIGLGFDTLFLPMDSLEVSLDKKYALVLDLAGSYSDTDYFLIAGNGVKYNVGSYLRGTGSGEWHNTEKDIGFSVEYLAYPRMYAYSMDQARLMYNQTIRERYSCDWSYMKDNIDVANVYNHKNRPESTYSLLEDKVPIMVNFNAYEFNYRDSSETAIYREFNLRAESTDWYGVSYWQGYGGEVWGDWYPEDDTTIFKGIRMAADTMIAHEDSLRPATYQWVPENSDDALTTALNGGRKLVFDSEGVWHRSYTHDGRVKYARSSDDGDSWTGPWDVGSGRYPTIAIDDQDSLHVAWIDSTYGILSLLFSSLIGPGWSDPGTLFTFPSTGYLSPPSLDMDTLGWGHVVFAIGSSGEGDAGGSPYGKIYHKKFNPVNLGDCEIASIGSTSVSRACDYPCIDVVGIDPHLAWQKDSLVIYRGKTGGSWSAPDTIAHGLYPYVEIHGDFVHFVWIDTSDVYHRRKWLEGDYGETEKVRDSGSAQAPGIAGGSEVFWFEDNIATSTDVLHSSCNRIMWSSATNISNSSDSCFYPHAAIEIEDTSSDIGVIWAEGNSSPYAIEDTLLGVTLPWQTSDTLTATAENNARRIAVDTTAEDSRAWIVYQADSSVYCAYSDKEGETWAEDFHLAYGAHPACALNASGKLHAVFTGHKESGKYDRIYYVRATVTGFSDTMLLYDAGNLYVGPPSFAVDTADGWGHVAFERYPASVGPGTPSEVCYFKFYTQAMEPDTSNFAVVDQSIQGRTELPSIGLYSNGDPCISWSKGGKVYFSKRSGSWQAYPDTVSGTLNTSCHPYLEICDDYAHVVWEEHTCSTKGVEIYHRAKGKSGGPWSSATDVSDSPNDCYRPVIASGCQIVWYEDVANTFNLYHCCLDSGAWSNPRALVASPSKSVHPQVCVTESWVSGPSNYSTLYYAWTEGDSGSYKLKMDTVVVTVTDWLGGTVTEDMNWRNDYRITGDVTVEPGVVLTIDPSIGVYFEPFFDDERAGLDTALSEFVIYGDLEIKGTDGNPVVFSLANRDTSEGAWYGIVLPGVVSQLAAHAPQPVGSSAGETRDAVSKAPARALETTTTSGYWGSGSSPVHLRADAVVHPRAVGYEARGVPHDETSDVVPVLEHDSHQLLQLSQTQEIKHSVIEYAHIGILADAGRPLETRHCHFGFCDSVAVTSRGSGLELKDCSFSDNNIGILTESSGEIKTSEFAGNVKAICCEGGAQPRITGNHIVCSKEIGVSIGHASCPNLGDSIEPGYNTIHGNALYDVYNNSNNTIFARWNYWGTMEPESIEAHIWDDTDDSTKGSIEFQPLWDGGGVPGGLPGPQLATRTDQPRAFRAVPGSPNPFGQEGQITIRFELPRETPVKIVLYNVAGQPLRTLVDRVVAAGRHSVSWDGTLEDGSSLPSGVYLYRLQAGEFVAVQKAVLLR